MKFFIHYLKHLLLLSFAAVMSSTGYADTVNISASLATPVIQAGKTQTAFLKVGLTGFSMPTQRERSASNLAIVIDKSGSMSGDRIERAKEAAIMAIESLGVNDIVSVIAFDHRVEVVAPASKVLDKMLITQAIKNIQVGGSTGLFAGVSKGAFEVRKFLDKTRVNRVILLSDGQANAGPSSPAELGQLGNMLAREGISVSTIGLGTGYNEDLMTQLATYSDGNHFFVANSRDLAQVFQKEFGDVGAVVAQDVELSVRLKRGVKPLRVLGREGEITNGVVHLRMNQLSSQQEKYALLEVEVPPGKAGENVDIATVEVAYLNMQSKNKDRLTRSVALGFADSPELVAKSVDKKVMVSAVQQIANENSKQALQLRDQGKVTEAKKLMEINAAYLSSNARSLGSDDAPTPELEAQAVETKNQAIQIESKDSRQWNILRKGMRAEQYKIEKQQK